MLPLVSTREDWMRRLGPLYGGAVALVHSTPWRWPDVVVDEPRSPGWVVALGAPIGAAAWAVSALAVAAGMPSTVGAVIAIAALALASALLVERGLAERVDRWQPVASVAAVRGGLGATAVVTLVLVTVLRIAALAAVRPERWLAVLVATALVGRWCAVLLQALGDPVRDDTSARSLVASPAPGWMTAALGVAAAVMACVALGGKLGLLAVAFGGLVAFVLGLDAQRRDSGLSAPVVATAAAAGELVVLLAATLS